MGMVAISISNHDPHDHILYREVPHMLPAKYQPNPPNGSEEEVIRMVFTIYGHGGHPEFRIMIFLA